MWELIVLGGVLILFWSMLRLGGNYLPSLRLPNRQGLNSKNARSIQLSSLTGVSGYSNKEKNLMQNIAKMKN